MELLKKNNCTMVTFDEVTCDLKARVYNTGNIFVQLGAQQCWAAHQGFPFRVLKAFFALWPYEICTSRLFNLLRVLRMVPPFVTAHTFCASRDNRVSYNLVPRGCIPFGQHQGCKTSGIINVKMLENRNLIGYYILPEVYEKEVTKQEIKMLRMFLLDVFDHVRDRQWERNLKMGDAN